MPPYQVHCLELWSEPEVDDGVLIQLAPDVQDAQDHGVHQELDVHEEGDGDGADPVEDEHEDVIGRTSLKDAGLKSDGVAVQEVQVDQEVKAGLRGQRVIEQGGDGSPYLKMWS